MPASKQPRRPSFGALVHGSDAPTEVFVPGSSPNAPSSFPTSATARIRPTESRDTAAMDARGAPPEQPEPERVVARFRSHGRRLFFPTVLLIGVTGATAYFSGWFAEEWQNWGVLAAGALLAVLFFVVPAVRWLSTRYVLTTRRIIFRHGLLVNTRSELLLARAHEVTVRKSVLQAMFRSGDVRIGTGAGEFAVLKDVPRADLVSTVLGDLLESQHVPRHGVHFVRPGQDDPRSDGQPAGWAE
jgi:membrane protein YdbS with pleckstrin-like domain